MKKIALPLLLAFILISCSPRTSAIRFMMKPNLEENASPAARQLIEKLQAKSGDNKLVVKFPKGQYHFYEAGSFEREYYISNHDQ